MFSNKAVAREIPGSTFVVRGGLERSDNDVGGDFPDPRTARATLH